MSRDAREIEEESTLRRARLLNIDYQDTSKMTTKQLFKGVLNISEMEDFHIVPLYADQNHITFGVLTTTSQQTMNNLRQRFSDQRLSFTLISDAGFRDYMLLYNPPARVTYQDVNINSDNPSDLAAQISQTLDQVRSDDLLAYLVQQAYKLKASDIHLEVQKDYVRIRFRVDGVLHTIAKLTPEKYRLLSSSIAVAGNVSTSDNQPQSGHISRNYTLATGEAVTVNLRIETVPTAYGQDAVMRLFNLKMELLSLDNLGLSKAEREVVDDIIKHPTGMVLVVGPTGSGKTTTLYSLINTLNTDERKIITLEDPIEYYLEGIVQIPVRSDNKEPVFAEELRAVLRLDPDVVMVGEIRDNDTAKTALQGALTGHLVMSTFHASSAAAALSRMMDMVGVNPLFASAIHLIMAQRLIRKLDPATKQAYKPDDALKSQLQTIINSMPSHVQKPDLNSVTLYKAGTSAGNPFGYTGQLAIREQLRMTEGVQQLLKLPPSQLTTEMLEAKAVEEGMLTMLQDGVLKSIAGETTLEEVYRVVG